MALIRLKSVEKRYWLGSSPVHALRGVSLTVNPGEFVAVMGPSGSGKSTLLHVLGLLDSYDSGSYVLAGEEVSRLGDDARALLRCRSIGFVFQQFNLLSRLSARENINLPLLYSSGAAAADAERLARGLSLSDRLEHRPGELSGGQQQRVAIARALMNGPKLILADEPTGNLDSHTQREIMDLLVRMNRAGLTILLVTHEMDISRYARRVIWMRDGRIVSDKRQRGKAAEGVRGRGMALASRVPAPALGAIGRGIMEARAHLSGAARSLAANKLRTVLSTLGITIGVGAVIAMLALGSGARRDIQDRLTRFGANMVSVYPNWRRSDGRGRAVGVTRLTIDDAAAVKKAHHSIKRTAPVLWEHGTVTANGKDYNTHVAGSSPNYAEMRDYLPEIGRMFTQAEVHKRARVCLLGHAVVEELYEKGDNPVGQTVRLNRVPYAVIGLLPRKGGGGDSYPDDLILMPITTGMYRFAGARYISYIDVEMEENANVEQVIDSIKSFLARRYRLKGDYEDTFRVRNDVAIREAFTEMTRTMTLLLGVIGGISLLVGGIGIMNIMLVSVTERTREIGLRKAIGARRKDIMTQFLVESAAISLAGGVLGILLGTGAAMAMALLLNWSVSVTAFSVILAFCFSAGVGVGFGFMPARRAASLHPSEALRYE